MKQYILKLLYTGTVSYAVYDGTTALTDAELSTLLNAAGSAYFTFDFNGNTPTRTDSLTIVNSSDTSILSNSGLDTITENNDYKGAWSDYASTFDSFTVLPGVAMDEAQLSDLMGKIKEAGNSGIPTTATFWGRSYNSGSNNVSGNIYGQVTSGTMFVVRGSSTSDGTAYLSLGSSSVGLYYNGSNSSGFWINSSGMNISNIPGINLSNGTSDPAQYKKIFNMADPTNAQDAATKNYTDNLVISYASLNGAGTPTTSTAAQYVGQLYYDTTNDDMYYCSAITAQGTTPETYEYTWNTIGGGGGLDPATTFWGQTASNGAVNGDMTYSDGTHTASIVKYLGATGTTADLVFGDSGPVQLGSGLKSHIEITEQSGNGRIKLWAPSSSILVRGSSFDFYAQTKITNVKNPTNAQDAATKNYVDTNVGDLTTLTTTAKTSAVAAINEVNGKVLTNAETIWTGTASGVSTVLNLSHPIYDYKYLLIRFGGAINRTKCELCPVEQTVTNNEFNLWLQQSTSVYTGCSLAQSTDTTGSTLTITNSNHNLWAENIIYEVKGIK